MKSHAEYTEKIDCSYLFLNTLKKENDFEFFPSVSGLTNSGGKLNLGFSTYALKILYMTKKLEIDYENRIDKWAKYLNTYQKENKNFPKNSFIDEALLKYYKNLPFKENFKYTVKSTLSYLTSAKYDSKKTKLQNAINADTKQAISTLYQIGYKNEKNFELELNENSITEYLNKLDWSKPWNAGAQFSSICVFSKTQNKDYSEELSLFLEKIIDKETGSYFMQKPKHEREIINGAMKVISGLEWLDQEIHYPDKLIDFCLNNKPIMEGCDVVDFIYVLYKCSQQTSYKKNQVNQLMNEIVKELNILYNSSDGGFSYYKDKSQTHYYGVQISNGENQSDLHGTLLCIWALVMVLRNNEKIDNEYRLIKP